MHRCELLDAPSLTPAYSNDPAIIPFIRDRESFSDLGGGLMIDADSISNEWNHFDRFVARDHATSGFLFSHSRTRPDGTQRLVAVRISPAVIILHSINGRSKTYSVRLPLLGETIIPTNSKDSGALSLKSAESEGPEIRFDPLNDRLTIYSGTIDPSDSTHFTIAYRFNTEAGTIDGRLCDGDYVRLVLRDGPLQDAR